LGGNLITHCGGAAIAPPISSCSFLFRVIGFKNDDLKKKKKTMTKEKEKKKKKKY